MRKQDKSHRKVRKCKAGPNFSGQHLLHHKDTIRRIIDLAKIKHQDTVLEIGPGKGALTVSLAEKAEKVIAIEYDKDFIEILQRKLALAPNVHIIERDFLEAHLPRKPFSVVANIPYAITTPILEKLLGEPTNSLQQAVLMMEKGAAKRFTAYPITNPKILKWRMWYRMELAFDVSPKYFSPPPRVESAVVKIERREGSQVLPRQHRQFMALAQYALRRPQLPVYEALKGVFTPPQIKYLAKTLKIDSRCPICSLKESQWETLFHTMVKHVAPFRWPQRL